MRKVRKQFRRFSESSWVGSHNPVNDLGCFMDFHLFCSMLGDTGEADLNTFLVTLDRQQKLDIESNLDGVALHSMHRKFPRIFCKGDIPTSPDASYCTAVKNHEAWSARGVGLKDRMDKALETFEDQLKKRIDLVLGNHFKAASLALEMVTSTILFCQNFITWSEQTFSDLTKKSKLDEDKAFCLLTMIWYRIFEDMAKARLPVSTTLGTSDPKKRAGLVLYGALRTHEVMQAYSIASFKDHPSVSSEYMKYMAVNTGNSRVSDMDSKFDDLSSDVKDAVKWFKAQKRADDTASKKVADLKSEFLELAKKMEKK